MSHRTRIKLCGLTRSEDIRAAVAVGADAIGLVFYPPSPRHVSAAQVAPIAMLQFHGDETPAQCAAIAKSVGRPFLRALRIRPETQPADLLESVYEHRDSSPLFAGLLLDTWSDAYGGTGKAFDWSLIPAEIAHQAVLSGGLNAQNVTDAVRRIRPHAVDVSSGIESSKGVKDAALMRAFVDAVRSGDLPAGSDSP